MSDKAFKLNGALDEVDKIRREIAEDGFLLVSEQIAKATRELRRLARVCAHAYGEATRGKRGKR